MRHLLTILFVLCSLAVAHAQDDLPTWLRELEQKKDDADVKLVQKIANAGTREAATGLLSAYDSMNSILMRREIVRALARFEGVAEAEQPCMQKLAEIAGNCEDVEVREAALKGLAQSPRMGKTYLKQLVEAQVPEDVRLLAMQGHVKMAAAEDAAWYRFVWNLRAEQRRDGKSILPPESNDIRELAFGALQEQLSEDELIETLRREYDPKIRRAALKAMQDRDLPKTTEMAGWVLDRVDFPGTDRAAAARILIDREGTKAVPTFLALVKKKEVTPDDLREEFARLIVRLHDDGVTKRMAKLVGKGKPHEKVFAILASAGSSDAKLMQAVRKELDDKDAEVRVAAARAVGERRVEAAEPALRKMLADSKVPGDQRLAVEALSAINGASAPWQLELAKLCTHPDRDVRNAAIEQLVAQRSRKNLPVLSDAMQHEDWATRLCAIDAFLAMGDKAAVPKLIERLGKEGGRMRKAVANALWQLTGQPFDEEQKQWQTWWASEGTTFEVISKQDLEAAEKRREQARLMQRTRSGAKFFGIKVESHRVVFIIDVSGSMLESVYGRTVDKHGASRLDVAKQELTQCIKNLEQGSLFNILAFSNGVARWFDGRIASSTAESRQAAITWIERLGAMGATNLYDSVKLAFDDPDVDTICILSDGEPNVGDEVDPSRIREKVAFWNEHRHVVINTIAVGGNFEVLEWLAQDSGGKHVQIR